MTNDSLNSLLLESLRCLILPALSRCGLLGVGSLLSVEAAFYLQVFCLVSAAIVAGAAASRASAAADKK